jgi:hypothetical protein
MIGTKSNNDSTQYKNAEDSEILIDDIIKKLLAARS